MSTHESNAPEDDESPDQEVIQRFIGAFSRVITALRLIPGPQEGGGAISLTDIHGNTRSVRLPNLFARVVQRPEEEWPELIEQFLAATDSTAMANLKEMLEAGLKANAEKLLPCFKPPAFRDTQAGWSRPLITRDSTQEVVSSILNTELSPSEASQRAQDALANASPDPSLLYLTLVIDLPETMAFVSSEMLDESGQSAEEWMAIAVNNLQERTPADWYEVIHQESGICRAVVQDSYDAPRMLLLDELLPDEAPMGWFVAPVARDTVYFVPASPEFANRYLLALREIAKEEFPEADHALSDELFWVHEGAWYHFPIDMVEGHPVALPPQEFHRVFGQQDE